MCFMLLYIHVSVMLYQFSHLRGHINVRRVVSTAILMWARVAFRIVFTTCGSVRINICAHATCQTYKMAYDWYTMQNHLSAKSAEPISVQMKCNLSAERRRYSEVFCAVSAHSHTNTHTLAATQWLLASRLYITGWRAFVAVELCHSRQTNQCTSSTSVYCLRRIHLTTPQNAADLPLLTDCLSVLRNQSK